MHSDEVVEAAIKMRLDGASIKSIARKLPVSVGWASENLAGVRPRLQPERRMLIASEGELSKDTLAWGKQRANSYAVMSRLQRTQRVKAIEVIKQESKQFRTLPNKASKAYGYLDRLQQLMAKDPGAGVFHLIAEQAKDLHAHLLGWLRDRHLKTQDKSDERFGELVISTRDFVEKHKRPPSAGSKDVKEVNAARWLGRWISNARGRGERKKNIARAEVFLKVGEIVDGLRSAYPALNEPAMRAVADGTWNRLFGQLLATKNSYEFEV